MIIPVLGISDLESSKMLGSVLARADLSRILFLSLRTFAWNLSPDFFLLIVVGKNPDLPFLGV